MKKVFFYYIYSRVSIFGYTEFRSSAQSKTLVLMEMLVGSNILAAWVDIIGSNKNLATSL
jgi:hypothetical protein